MKSVLTHGVLALLGLGFAYQTWTRPPESDEPEKPGQSVLLECSKDSFSKLEYEVPTHKVTIVPQKEKDGLEYWITSVHKKIEPKEKPKDAKAAADKAAADKAAADKAAAAKAAAGSGAPKPADAKVDANAKPAEPPKPTEPAKPAEDDANKPARKYDPEAPFVFAANPKFDEMLGWITPLHANRSLGKLAKDKEKAFGLDNVGTYLRIECGGKKVALDVGGRTFGSGDRYVRDHQSGDVYLVDGPKLTDLQSAQFKFMQGDVHNFTLDDVDEVTIKAAGKERRLMHRNRKVKEEATWVDAANPDRRNELYGNWFQRLAMLKVRAYLGPKEEPGADLQIPALGSAPVMTIDYKVDGKPSGKLEVVRVDTKPGPMYYGRSEATHRWVALFESTAKQLEDDVPLVVGAEQPAQQSAPESPAAPAAAPTPAAAPAALPPGHPPMH